MYNERNMEPRTIKPDFIMIPYVLYETEGLQSVDRDVYGAIYWFEHMKDGVCKASNETIASIVHAVPRSVQNALGRLENAGLILREYKDASKKNRSSIKALVAFKYSSSQPMKSTEKKTEKKQLSVEVKETPRDYARRFFDGDKQARKEVIEAMLIGSHGKMKEDFLLKEIQKFILYWTEPTPNGKSQKWEKQQTFEIKRRLYTWLSQPWKKGGGSTQKSSAGAGVVI